MLTATDALNPAVIGTSNVIAVGPGVVSRFILTAPASTIAGSPFVLQVTAVDQFNNRVTNYTGSSHSPAATLRRYVPLPAR